MGVGPRNDDFVSFQRLAQAIQGLGAKFRQFVEEKHAIVRKRHLARPHPHAAPREGGHDGYGGDGQRHRRRHRGGRGHGNGGPQGFRGDGPRAEGGQRSEGGFQGGERQGGNRRRRSRGGSGRDRGGNPRSEGSQGGGAI